LNFLIVKEWHAWGYAFQSSLATAISTVAIESGTAKR